MAVEFVQFRRAKTPHFMAGVAWTACWLTNSYIWVADIASFRDC